MGFTPQNGMQVVVRAKISLYEPRGEYQIVVEHMEEAGDGALRRKFDQLKQQLMQEGLFAAERKKSLPLLPRCVGVITSPTGAAIHDILTTLKRRSPGLPVIIYPSSVQGKDAPTQLVDAINLAAHRGECDVLILARGGGSLEDLWPFNEESVARAIAACQIPIVSGVGHDVDFTIADFVADVRAPTPTGAAEFISPDNTSLLQRVFQLSNRLGRHVRMELQRHQALLSQLGKRLQHPGKRVQGMAQRLDECELRLQRGILQRIKEYKAWLTTTHEQLLLLRPSQRVVQNRQHLGHLSHRLHELIRQHINVRTQLLASSSRALNSISPLATLERGYTITTDPKGRVVSDAKTLHAGDKIQTRFRNGYIKCLVEDVHD